MALQGSGGTGPLSPGEATGKGRFDNTGTGSSAGTGSVYMGMTPQQTTGRDSVLSGAYGAKNQGRAPMVVPESEAENDIYNWSDKSRDDFLAKGLIGGLLKAGDGVMEATTLWKKLVKQSAAYTAAGRKLSPWDVLGLYVNTDSKGKPDPWQTSADGKFSVNVLTGEKKYIGPQFSTTSQTRTDLTDPTTAKAIATSVFQQMMGRDPGKGELASWGSALSQAEQASPVVDTTTTQYDMDTGEAVATNTTSAGGLSADAKQYMEQQKVKKTPEYGAVQAATTFSNALENAVYGAPS